MAQRITVGRRKTAVARVKMFDGSGKVTVNGRAIETYFPLETHRQEILKPLQVTDNLGRYDVSVVVEGGGSMGQAQAIKLGIARSIVASDEEQRGTLRTHGLLTRDPRAVERKKYGQKKARKRFQFSKR
jgi:small subunit ribosomal protein S9